MKAEARALLARWDKFASDVQTFIAEVERDATHATQLEEALREAKQRMHLILSVIYATHGYMRDGEIDTAAKFRSIERLARLDWNADGTPREALRSLEHHAGEQAG